MWVIEKEAGIIGLERGIQTRFRSRALCSGQSIGTTGDDWRGERGEPHHRLRSAASVLRYQHHHLSGPSGYSAATSCCMLGGLFGEDRDALDNTVQSLQPFSHDDLNTASNPSRCSGALHHRCSAGMANICAPHTRHPKLQ